MLQKLKISKPPTTQRSFPNVWGELEYLCKKTRFWLYVRRQPVRARRYLPRLQCVLLRLPKSEMSILREEGRALLCELEGMISESVRHREREIELMERLHQEARLPKYTESTRSYMLRDRGEMALRDRRDILESLKERVRSARRG